MSIDLRKTFSVERPNYLGLGTACAFYHLINSDFAVEKAANIFDDLSEASNSTTFDEKNVNRNARKLSELLAAIDAETFMDIQLPFLECAQNAYMVIPSEERKDFISGALQSFGFIREMFEAVARISLQNPNDIDSLRSSVTKVLTNQIQIFMDGWKEYFSYVWDERMVIESDSSIYYFAVDEVGIWVDDDGSLVLLFGEDAWSLKNVVETGSFRINELCIDFVDRDCQRNHNHLRTFYLNSTFENFLETQGISEKDFEIEVQG